jgi:CHRD domain
MSKRTGSIAVIVVGGAFLVGALASIGAAGPGKNKGKPNRLSSYLEVPAVSSVNATGSIELRVGSDSIAYKLTYSGLTGPATFAHIHFAQPGVNGGIAAFLCGGGGKAACPGAAGTASGTIAAGDINPLGQTTAQGLLVNEMSELIAAIRAGVVYANVHTAAFPSGELRGQVKARGRGKDDDD